MENEEWVDPQERAAGTIRLRLANEICDVQIIIINSIILSVRISFPLLNNLAEADYMYGI